MSPIKPALLRFPENFARLIGMHGLTQKDAAEIFGISAHTISSWNKSRRTPSQPIMYEVARFFDVSLELVAYGDAVDVVQAAAEPERFLQAEDKIRRHNAPLKAV